jgi:hypothetical protein
MIVEFIARDLMQNPQLRTSIVDYELPLAGADGCDVGDGNKDPYSDCIHWSALVWFPKTYRKVKNRSDTRQPGGPEYLTVRNWPV